MVALSWPAASTPRPRLSAISISGLLKVKTSSRNTEMFMALGSGMPSSRAQVP